MDDKFIVNSDLNDSNHNFFDEFISFVKQAISGLFIASWRFLSDEGSFKNHNEKKIADIFNQEDFLFKNLVGYFNKNWKNFHLKNDEYVNKTFTNLMNFSKIKHESCIFHFTFDFCQILLNYCLHFIEKIDFNSKSSLQTSLNLIIYLILKEHEEFLKNGKFECNEKCEPSKYNEGEEFIKIENPR